MATAAQLEKRIRDLEDRLLILEAHDKRYHGDAAESVAGRKIIAEIERLKVRLENHRHKMTGT